MKANLEHVYRVAAASDFERNVSAITLTLQNRYHAVRRPHAPEMVAVEAMPLASLSPAAALLIVPEYVVDQELPGQAEPWLASTMGSLLRDFFAAHDDQHAKAFLVIYLALYKDMLDAHWLKWCDEELLGAIYDRAEGAGLSEFIAAGLERHRRE